MIIQEENIIIESPNDIKTLNRKLNYPEDTKLQVIEEALWYEYGLMITVISTKVEEELKLLNLL